MKQKETFRKSFIGIVVAARGDKTIRVEVKKATKHALYGKRVFSTKKFAAHDEENLAGLGDKVKIEECRPISKQKKFRLVQIIEKGVSI